MDLKNFLKVHLKKKKVEKVEKVEKEYYTVKSVIGEYYA